MNPWLEIPLDEYEAHMALVTQAQYLSRVLGESVQKLQPASVAIIGCAGGNGLLQLPPDTVHRVVGIDINPRYIEATRERFKTRFLQLELLCHDFISRDCVFEPVDLVYAGLVFEYVDCATGLSAIKRFMKPGGYLLVVLQLPNEEISAVSPTPYCSLNTLEGSLRFVPPDDFVAAANAIGLSAVYSKLATLESGKSFQELLFTWNCI